LLAPKEQIFILIQCSTLHSQWNISQTFKDYILSHGIKIFKLIRYWKRILRVFKFKRKVGSFCPLLNPQRLSISPSFEWTNSQCWRKCVSPCDLYFKQSPLNPMRLLFIPHHFITLCVNVLLEINLFLGTINPTK